VLDWAPDSEPAEPSAPGGELEGLPSWLWLDDALSEDWLEELLEELLEALLGGVGGVEEGVGGVGGCGTVGVLALGQPCSSRQMLEIPASCSSKRLFTRFDVICPDQFVCHHRLTCLKPGSKLCTAQHPHQANGRGVHILVGIQSGEIYHIATAVYPEF
jgi:hypothetical protein